MVEIRESDDAIVIHVDYELDMESSPVLEAAIRVAARDIAPGQGLIVSLEHSLFGDASGLTVLVQTKKLLGSRFCVVASEGCPARRILKIARLERYVSVRADLEHARHGFAFGRQEPAAARSLREAVEAVEGVVSHRRSSREHGTHVGD